VASRQRKTRIGFALAIALYASCAQAHTGTGLPGGVVQGFAHPFGGLDHLLAMVSVGLWGAFLGRPLIYALPVVFPIVMVVGAAFGMFGVPLPRVEIGVALSVLVLGLCIVTAWRAPAIAAALIVAVFAMFHGYAHGRELPSAADPVGYSIGFVLATGLLHVLGIGIGALADRPRAAIIVRALGAAIACVGVVFVRNAASTGAAVELGDAAPLLALAPLAAGMTFLATRVAASRKAIVPKVVAGWLLAVALLATLLHFVPITLGYARSSRIGAIEDVVARPSHAHGAVARRRATRARARFLAATAGLLARCASDDAVHAAGRAWSIPPALADSDAAHRAPRCNRT
jgi:urease accessory protein